MNLVTDLLKQEKGSVLLYITLCMVVLLAFGAGVMDMGLMFENRRQLQNGVDSAAMAGTEELLRFDLSLSQRQTQAINTSLDYAQRNGLSLSQIDPGYPQVACVPLPYNNNCDPASQYYYNAVKMSAGRDLDLLVARLFNTSSSVKAISTAIFAPEVPTENLWPWGVPQCGDWNLSKQDCWLPQGVPIALKVGTPIPKPGNFMPLAFPGTSGANDYRNVVKKGYGDVSTQYIKSTLPWCGDSISPCAAQDNPYVTTETGNVVGPTKEGVDYLTSMAASTGQDDLNSSWNSPVKRCTWPGAPKRPSDLPPPYGSGNASPPPSNWTGDAAGCYRIGAVPILSQASYDQINGKGPVDIIGWGGFYLIGYANAPGGKIKVLGYYLSRVQVAGGHFSNNLTGLLGVRLWE